MFSGFKTLKIIQLDADAMPAGGSNLLFLYTKTRGHLKHQPVGICYIYNFKMI